MRAALVRLAAGIVALGMSWPAGEARAQDTGLRDAVRTNDARSVVALLQAGVDVDGRDDIGATPLMWAAAVGSGDTLQLVLDHTGDINAKSHAGGTALMWAAGDLVKVRMLLDRGAAVNARMNDGTTALAAAARRGSIEVMRELVSRGFDPSLAGVGERERAELLRIAHGTHTEMIPLLAEVGIALDDRGSAAVPSLANYPVTNPGAIAALLQAGADPNPRGRFPMLGAAALQGQAVTVGALLDQGADPDGTGQHGVTPLMMAAAAFPPNPGIVERLLSSGAQPDARDEAGRTALDWAALLGETSVVRVLREWGVPTATRPPPPSGISPPRSARAAVREALDRLTGTGRVLYERSQCVSCHHQMLPVLAMTAARARGVAVPDDDTASSIRAILDVWDGRREGLMVGREVAGGANELTYGLLALSEAGESPSPATDGAVVSLLSLQRQDGSWVFLDTRPPQADNRPISFTAMAIRGLQAYGPAGLRPAIRASSERAVAFLRTASSATTQDETFRLLGLVWSRVPAPDIAAQAQGVAALQRDDGGWSQLPTMTSDAYATGQALYALQTAGMPATDPVYQRGVDYLLRTQLDDGTWFVRSHAFGFQPYFETGFPHGPDQFISASATSWAVLALTAAL